MCFQCFYVSATRLQFCEVTKKVHALLRHDALEGVHVHEMTLCVTFGAPPLRRTFSPLYSMLQICCVSHGLGHACPPDHTVRNVLCARPFDSVGPLGPLPGPLGPPRRSWDSGAAPPGAGWASKLSQDDFRTLLRHARDYIQTSGRVSSVDGSAMHMKWPDGIGREAGIGRTRRGQELRVFRACP